jgi:hypothetical protein
MQDTSPRQRQRYLELLRAKQPHERLAIAMSLSNAVRELATAGLRARHTAASDEELRVRLAVRLYGGDVGIRLFGTIPDDAV